MGDDIFARVYGTEFPAWEDESPAIRRGIERYRVARTLRLPERDSWEWGEWFGLNDPEDLPIHPEPTPTNTLPVGFPTDDLLIPHIRMARWRKSRGYVRPDKQRVGAHEYLVKKDHPDLFRLLRERIVHGGDGYWATYKGYTNWYVHLDGYKYWATFVGVLNREHLPEEQEQEQHAEQLRLGLE